MSLREHQLMHEIERENELLDELAVIESRLVDAFANAIGRDTKDKRPRT